jgi:hypothetical protein
MPKLAIVQSSYIPWKGYFDIIHEVDEFIFLDDVQFTPRDWRSRNRIKTPQGPAWLTIPVGGHRHRRICDVQLPQRWADSHWRRIEACYHRAPFFEQYRPILEPAFRENAWRFLSDLNQHLIRTIARDALGIETRFRDSRELELESLKQDRIMEILQKTGGDIYISGPAARSYLRPERFAELNIELRWKDYARYPEYPQFHPPFVHEVTILDLLFHTGPDAPHYVWGWR